MFFVKVERLSKLKRICDKIEELNQNEIVDITYLNTENISECLYKNCLNYIAENKLTNIFIVFSEECKHIFYTNNFDVIRNPEVVKNDVFEFIREYFENVPPFRYKYLSIEDVFDDLKKSSLIDLYDIYIYGTVKKNNICDVVIDKKNKKIEICESKSTNIFTIDVVFSYNTIYDDRKKYI